MNDNRLDVDQCAEDDGRFDGMLFLQSLVEHGDAMTHEEAGTALAETVAELVGKVIASGGEQVETDNLTGFNRTIGEALWWHAKEKQQRDASSVPLLTLADHPSARDMLRLAISALHTCERGLEESPNDIGSLQACLNSAKCDLQAVTRLFECPGAHESGVILSREQTMRVCLDAFSKGLNSDPLGVSHGQG